MKLKYIVLGLTVALASMFAGCDSVIDIEPEFVLDGSQRFNSLDDYEFSLTGTYAQFRSSAYYGNASGPAGAFSTLPDMMSDNLTETGESLANFNQLVNFDYAADNDAIEGLWTAAYRIIAQANITLRGIDEFATENPGQYNRIKGQALAIRAYVHFDLLRYFGDDLALNSTTLGVPYKTEFNLDNIARPTVAETWEGIFTDLNEAKTLLSDTDETINSSSNFSLRANIDPITVEAILARAYLYSGQNQQAIAAATIVINQVPLVSRANFPAIWRDENIGSAELIWSVPFNSGEGTPAANVYFASGNRSSFRPSTEVLGEYDQANDIRYSTYFRINNNRTIVSKFIGKGSLSDGIVNWKVIRVSEMYLIRAEAYTNISGNTANALRDLNTLRSARITGYVPAVLAGQALVDAIALERRKELFVEGHRFFDVKRTTRNLVRSDCGTNFTTCSLTAGNRAWAWPIPIGEIIANDLISDADQNPGYN
ncbi:RagB/SusD family nutrient uptake outer membrane protein [Algoriphagus antarcticus]|uniref:SusD-like starch-binding protein associating with outer membrane n=1 Tax=Algoriphagus antarcticus TaxID=238540 RepID=A0A3E0E2L1_9BACT|nr:RagB/SusD family nutrient uptake outer membrane protein [Algoriphagus antarcticus]REG91569.1 SusD-like starch-binding protein associating with outer membrane [Algoriphagus antarcticus]